MITELYLDNIISVLTKIKETQKDKILSAAEDCGIVFGASRRRVRSEKTKNALLSAIPQLQWAGVNTSGCVATISVRERTEAVQAEDSKFIQSIVAIRDGYVLSATVTEGTGLVIPGQSVQKGQILISGYTDCGICIRAEGAAGEVMAQTSRELEAVMPAKYDQRTQNREVRKHYSLLIGKKRIKLWKDRIRSIIIWILRKPFPKEVLAFVNITVQSS